MFGDEHYGRYVAPPTGWRRNGVIGITATLLMSAGLLFAAATTDGAGAATTAPDATQHSAPR
jgi:hypothetical protein